MTVLCFVFRYFYIRLLTITYHLECTIAILLYMYCAGLVDEDTANIIEGVADAAENQASADRDASLTDRLKMAGGDAAGMVADNVDNPYVTVSSACKS